MRFTNLKAKRQAQIFCKALCCLCVLATGQLSAAWFQATGQAEIVDGDKAMARNQATQEAIKQALLFAGASVTSVQQLTNGLLQDERLEVRSTGEVNTVELIDEVYHDKYVTVSIRADIFPQLSQCSASNYKKTVVTAQMQFSNRAQIQDGKLGGLATAIPEKLPMIFDAIAPNTVIRSVLPQEYNWDSSHVQRDIAHLARQADAQYVLTLSALDVSVERPEGTLAFWKDTNPKRAFAIRARVYDGMTGQKVVDTSRFENAMWHLSKFESVDPRSREFWMSPYGKMVTSTLESLVTEVNDALSCHRAVGRVLAVANNQLQINLGEDHAVQRGDNLVVYKTHQLVDPFGRLYNQHVLYPTEVVVSEVYAQTATVTSVNGTILADIQPNDFVAKR